MSVRAANIRPRWRLAVASIGVAVGVVLSIAVFSAGGEGVFTHVVCAPSGAALPPFKAWIPTALANAPYGGIVWVNATVPPGSFLSSPGAPNGYGMGLPNGTAAWAGFGAEFNVTPQSNQSRFGPGLNTPCTKPFQVAPSFWGNVATGIPLLGEGNTTDANEPSTLGSYIPPSTVELGISNSFSVANQAPVSTCGSGATGGWLTSAGFVVSVPIASGTPATTQALMLPFVGSFHYWFPANFGTWEVDNLSAPGGPGGGWAFSFSACA